MAKIEKLYKTSETDSYRRNLGGHHRCSICNSVSNEDIATEIGDYKGVMSFTPDPNDKNHYICVTCADEINDLRMDYDLMDTWKDDF